MRRKRNPYRIRYAGCINASSQRFTLIEATESGWWSSVPLPGDGLAVACMTDADLHPHGRERDVTYWRAELERAPHTLERAASLMLDGKLRVALANTSHLVPVYGKGWVAVGDAAAACDPLSGDGVCRALQAGIDAAAAVLGEQAGDESALLRHSERLEAEFESYLVTQQTYYSREQRWPELSFWKRRRRGALRLRDSDIISADASDRCREIITA